MGKALTWSWACLLTGWLAASTQADTLEQILARRFTHDYLTREAQLDTIDFELESLPLPYLREPTGTGGFLSNELKASTNEVSLIFSWKTPVALDAVALFPLRLFMDEVYGENLYWPERITLEATIDRHQKILAVCANRQTILRQSLPELVRFDPVLTSKLTIRCTGLPQHPHEKWYAAGFSEIFIFSGTDNVAPKASLKTNNSRQGYYVLAKEFLVDTQTPLGIPEISSRGENHGYIKKNGFKKPPFVLTLIYPEPLFIDAVRIDPAIQHSYGQSFPTRFIVELLDDQSRVIQSDKTYEKRPLRNPGLNPHFSYFRASSASAVRLTVLETSSPLPKTASALAFSEITPMLEGRMLSRPTAIEELFQEKTTRINLDEPQRTENGRMLASVCDGLTQSGTLLPLRAWVEGLVRRQQLLEDQVILQTLQKQSIARVQATLILGSLALLLLGIGSALLIVVRHRIRTGQELRLARAKIASDLHDDVGSNLGTIILHTEYLKKQLDSPNERERLNSIYRLTRESVFGLREVLHTTAPEVGRSQDIIAYMRELAGLILGKTGYTFEAGPAMSNALLEQTLRKGILLFYKEALYNAKTHADCSQIDISLRRKNKTIVLTVKDNGKGISEQELKKARTLRTLKQRAEWLHAALQIQSEPDEGTEITLTIPA
jgi:signal transduction histidine kinase